VSDCPRLVVNDFMAHDLSAAPLTASPQHLDLLVAVEHVGNAERLAYAPKPKGFEILTQMGG
jgi:hypothetical protein